MDYIVHGVAIVGHERENFTFNTHSHVPVRCLTEGGFLAKVEGK